MNIYPAIKAKMGSWNYYIVKMKMKEIAAEVSFAHEVQEDPTLDNMIQRLLDDKRAKDDIFQYLVKREDRFFGSIVVAAIGGNPTFASVTMEDKPELAFFGDQDFGFGILRFNGNQNYYALDGQHRLKAIKTLVQPEGVDMELVHEYVSEDRLLEEVSVLIVMPGEDANSEGFRSKYRRLFSSLNRYAKPMDQYTNIVMDEDDVFAIITRRLITDHEHFKSTGDFSASFNIKDRKGKNLTKNDPWFLSLEGFYDLNKIWLITPSRERELGWGNKATLNKFLQYRPQDEEMIDAYFDELSLYWQALFNLMPELGEENLSQKRIHNSDEGPDMLYFWPIGQEILIREARALLDDFSEDPDNPSFENCINVLQPLKDINFEMHSLPWRHLILIKNDDDWKMRNEGRADAVLVARLILRQMLRPDGMQSDDLDQLKALWIDYLDGTHTPEEVDEMWEEIVKLVS